MILPTRAQMHRLAPTSEWQETQYTDERWKYDAQIVVPWDQLILQRAVVPARMLAQGVSISTIPEQQSLHVNNEIAQLVDILYERGMVIRIARWSNVTLSLSDIIDAHHAIKKIIIIAEAGSHVTWHDKQIASMQPILCTAIDVYVHEGAQFHYNEQQRVPDNTFVLYTMTIFADADSTVTIRSMAQGAAYAKTFVTTYLQGPRANITMHFGAILAGTQHHSLISEQHHSAAATLSHCTVQYVQYDRARTMYDGKIIIEKNGIQSEASQQHKALLIHEGTRAYARPTLQAKTNDVQCGHGSAIGMIDAEQLWYLQSRGIGFDAAQKMIIHAFLHKFFL